MLACYQPAKRRYVDRIEEVDVLISEQRPYLSDFCRGLESKGHRRSYDKTQVHIWRDNIHARNRGVHSDEVVANSVFLGASLYLNVDLCMSGSVLHDVGHTSFGHLGETVLSEYGGRPFSHNVFGVIVAQEIERKGRGLNLTNHTLKGILRHSRGKGELRIDPSDLQEYNAIMYADKISYVSSDYNDAVRFHYLDSANLPVPDCVKKLGTEQRVRDKKILYSVIEESRKNDRVQFSSGQVFEQFEELRAFMYKHVYPSASQDKRCEITLKEVCEFFSDYNDRFSNVDPVILAALLTDSEVFRLSEFISRNKIVSNESINNLQLSISEIHPHLAGKNIDYSIPDLSWCD